MKENLIALKNLPIGRTAIIKYLSANGAIRRMMLELGLISGTVVEAMHKSPSGDPTAYNIRGAVIALRSEEAGKILVELN